VSGVFVNVFNRSKITCSCRLTTVIFPENTIYGTFTALVT